MKWATWGIVVCKVEIVEHGTSEAQVVGAFYLWLVRRRHSHPRDTAQLTFAPASRLLLTCYLSFPYFKMSAKIEKTLQRQREKYVVPVLRTHKFAKPADPAKGSQRASTTKPTNNSASSHPATQKPKIGPMLPRFSTKAHSPSWKPARADLAATSAYCSWMSSIRAR